MELKGFFLLDVNEITFLFLLFTFPCLFEKKNINLLNVLKFGFGAYISI